MENSIVHLNAIKNYVSITYIYESWSMDKGRDRQTEEHFSTMVERVKMKSSLDKNYFCLIRNFVLFIYFHLCYVKLQGEKNVLSAQQNV